MKYIIDTDPGIDDAIAIMLGIKNNLDVIGFTLVSGNIPVVKSEKNLKIIQDFLETNIKMYHGSVENSCNHKTAEFAHGIDGLGYTVFPNNNPRKFEKLSAEDFIIKASKKYQDNLTIICLGPLTNLANAIKRDKTLYKRVKHVLIMGASYNPNNNEKYIEFNVNVDPESAELVFNTPFEDIKIVTHEIGITSFIEREYMDNLRNSEHLISRFVGEMAQKYMEFSYQKYGVLGLTAPDPTAIASIVNSKVIKFEPCQIKLVKNKDNKSECHVDLTPNSNIKISTNFDLELFRKIFKNTFN